MSVSSINSGISPNQATPTGVLPQRGARTELSAVITDSTNVPEQTTEAAVPHLGTSAPLFNLVGVAAYSAIMNPQLTTSMSIEA